MMNNEKSYLYSFLDLLVFNYTHVHVLLQLLNIVIVLKKNKSKDINKIHIRAVTVIFIRVTKFYTVYIKLAPPLFSNAQEK